MEVTKTVTLDISKEFYNTITAKQNDSYSRYVIFNLVNNGVSLDLTGHTVVFFAKKPDNNEIYNNCTITNYLNGQVRVELTSQTLAVVGTLQCELVIYGPNSSKLSTSRFTINVLQSVNSENAIISSNEFSALTDALDTVNNFTYVDDAVGINFVPYGGITGANVQAALQQIIDMVNSLSSGTPEPPVTSDYVRITTTGSTFSPIVQLASGSTATVSWTVEGGSTYTGLTPTINFGTAATRYIRMSATENELNALNDIETFNIGFDYTADAGLYNVGASYNHTSQSVSALEDVNAMTGLKRFLANAPTLSGALDFTGMSALEYIECYNANISSVNLTGCTSLIRLCMEGDNLATLDLNPVAGNLYDLRASGNQSPLTFTPLTSPMAHLYHYCAQSETVINHPTPAQLPVIEELWDWSSGQSGALVVRSSAIRSIMSMGNNWTSADLENQFPAGRSSYVYLRNCQLSSIILTGCNGLDDIDLQNNLLGQAAIDGILSEVESWGTSNGTLNLSDNAGPSSAGAAKATTLISRGWTVTTEATTEASAPSISSSYNTTLVSTTTEVNITYSITDVNGGPFTASYVIDGGTPTTASGLTIGSNTWAVGTLTEGNHTLTIQVTDSTSLASNTLTFNIESSASVGEPTTLWTDDFERANCTGVANVGNGWHTSLLMDCDISSGNIVLTNSAGYGRLLNTAGGALPANYTVSMTLPATARGTFFGLIGRWYNGNGVRLLFPNEDTITIGDASGYDTNNVTVTNLGFPASWNNAAITHTVAMKMVGTSIEIYIDEVLTATATCATNANQAGTEVGFCGESQNRQRLDISVTEVVVAPTAPVISSSYSTTEVYTTTEVSIPYSINDVNGGTFTATYTIDGGTPTTVNNLSLGSNTWAVGTLAEGAHTLTIQVADSGALTSNTLTFNITSSVAGGGATTLWEDTFERANVTGVANVANGWHTGSIMGCDISSGDLILTGATQYAYLLNTAGGSLPADYTVTMTIPVDTTGTTNADNRGSYWGLIGRWYGGTGVKIFWDGAGTNRDPYWGSADAYGGTAITLTYPTDWDNDSIEHTVGLRFSGTTVTVVLDGQDAGSFTSSINSAQTGTEVGFCGESQNRHRESIAVTTNA